MTIIEFPESLKFKEAFFERHFASLNHPLTKAVKKLLYTSDYACRYQHHLQKLLSEDDCQNSITSNEYKHLVSQLSLDCSTEVFSKNLREFRHRHLLRILLREYAYLADTEETMAAWSACADAILLHAQAFSEKKVAEQYGFPYQESGAIAQLFLIAVGKLGGKELNISSDVDLMFAFSGAGFTNGNNSISNQEYFNKVVRQFVQLLQNKTEEGFVFRVDLRLRPNGDSGPLVYSLAAMETYYQEQGRDWERYAMVKARLLNEETYHPNHWFHRLITSFVYRRYVDFSVIESLRSMKAMIEREIQLKPMLNDIKRGRGGIREIEFIIQCFQLIRGGRILQLQHQNAMQALAALKQQNLLSHALTIKRSYLFLRKLENALQAHHDLQTHTLPQDKIICAQITMAMGLTAWEEVIKRLERCRKIVSDAFQEVLGKTNLYENEKRLLHHQLSSLWQGQVEATMSIHLLESLEFQEASRCYQMIHTFRHSPRCRRLSQTARLRLDQFMVLLLSELTNMPNTDTVLLQVMHLLESIIGRSAYLTLLIENPSVLRELLYWFAHSSFMTSLFVNQPFLLEVLIDQNMSWRPPSRQQLRVWLQERLKHCIEQEMQDELLRQFKLTCWLLAARAEFHGHSRALRIGRFLADVAEVIIAEVITEACRQLSYKYPEIISIQSRFAVVAYGKLGSREMNYDSDLDLVFLHSARPSEEALVTRLTQKILHRLTVRSQSGVLFKVDTRLRPSGAAGLLVSHIDAFVDYQRAQAWTWEHQALLRARLIYASKSMQVIFNQLKEDVLFLPRNKQAVAKDITSMRAKINQHQAHCTVKHRAGGLLDLEFLVQYLILTKKDSYFSLCTNTLQQLRCLYQKQVLTRKDFLILTDAYRHYHQILHHEIILKPNSSITISANFTSQVLRVMQKFL